MKEIKNFSNQGGAEKGENLIIETEPIAEEKTLEAHINPKTGKVEKYFIKDKQGKVLEFADLEELRKRNYEEMLSRSVDNMSESILESGGSSPIMTPDELGKLLNAIEKRYLNSLIDEDEATEN